MKEKLIISCVIGLFVFSSCQKELDKENIPRFCAVSSILVTNGSGKSIARYSYDYDSLTRRVVTFKLENMEAGTTKTIRPTYSKDTIFLAQNSYMLTDQSNRLQMLVVPDASGSKTISYYYTYNSFGFLNERLIDDGFYDAIRTNFSYVNESLSAFKEDFSGFPQSLSATVNYNTTSKITAFNQLVLLELFPELLLYLPAIHLGKTAGYPLAEIENKVGATNLPAFSFTNTYSQYTFTTEGWLFSFQSDQVVNGVSESNTRYSFEYKCY